MTQYRPRSELLFQLNPWPQYELSLSKYWQRAGTFYSTKLVIPDRKTGLDIYSDRVKGIAEFALKEVRKQSGTECSWTAGCMQLAAVISCESQKVEVEHVQKLSGTRMPVVA